jgi:hypothetical protein
MIDTDRLGHNLGTIADHVPGAGLRPDEIVIDRWPIDLRGR